MPAQTDHLLRPVLDTSPVFDDELDFVHMYIANKCTSTCTKDVAFVVPASKYDSLLDEGVFDL